MSELPPAIRQRTAARSIIPTGPVQSPVASVPDTSETAAPTQPPTPVVPAGNDARQPGPREPSHRTQPARPTKRATPPPTRAQREAQARYDRKGRKLTVSAVPLETVQALDVIWLTKRDITGETYSEFMRDQLAEVVARYIAENGPLDMTRVVRKQSGAPRRYLDDGTE